jgi:hypothetical protein
MSFEYTTFIFGPTFFWLEKQATHVVVGLHLATIASSHLFIFYVPTGKVKIKKIYTEVHGSISYLFCTDMK